MPEAAQRATLVLERDPEEGDWYVVAYLVRDSGRRDRKTITRRDSREEASEALLETWNTFFGRKGPPAA